MKRVFTGVVLALVLLLVSISPVYAISLGFTGNFYLLHFYLEQGQSSTEEAYLIAINTSAEPELVTWSSVLPEGVTIALPEPRVLQVNEQWRVNLVVEVGDVLPGDYQLTVRAVATDPDETGIISGAGGVRTALLTVLAPFLLGDANSNGVVNIVDAMFVAQSTVGLREVDRRTADVNQDSHVTIVDAMFIVQYTIGLRDTEFNWIGGN